MILSIKHKFLFARGIKTASTSMANELSSLMRSSEKSYAFKLLRRFPGIKNTYPFYDFINHPHTSLSKANKIIPKSIFDSSFKFGVVREPASWMLSTYKHCLRHKRNNYLPENVKSLEDFILFRLDHYQPLQSLQFINNDGLLLANELGNFHNINPFIAELSSKLNLSINLKHLNSSKIDNIKISKKDRTLIEKACALDYELFDFEDLSGPFIIINEKNQNFLKNKLRGVWIQAGGYKFDPWHFR